MSHKLHFGHHAVTGQTYALEAPHALTIRTFAMPTHWTESFDYSAPVAFENSGLVAARNEAWTQQPVGRHGKDQQEKSKGDAHLPPVSIEGLEGRNKGEFSNSPEVQAERKKLQELAEKSISDPAERKKFLDDMETFERRAKERNLPASEVSKTYQEISRLIDTGAKQLAQEKPYSDTVISGTAAIHLAQQVMSQAADPTTICQGHHNTCNVTTVETRTYTMTPSAAAHLVADVALGGRYTTAKGRTIQLDKNSLYADMEEATHPPTDGQRSHASRIFQVTAVNVAIDNKNSRSLNPSKLRYEQHASENGDSGERWMDYSKNPPEVLKDKDGKPVSHPQLSITQLREISNSITGKKERDVALMNTDRDSDATTYRNDRELHDLLAKLKRENKLPVIMWVDPRHEPFHTECETGASDKKDKTAHVITITDYDPKTQQATIDNQWTKACDHSISTHDLYLASYPAHHPESMKRLQRDVEWDRKKGTPDGFKELELLRLKLMCRSLTDEEYDKAVIQTMRTQIARWKTKGETYPGEQARTQAKLAAMMQELPASRGQEIIRQSV